MEKDKANKRRGHLMVSGHRRPRPRVTPEEPAFLVEMEAFLLNGFR